MKQKAMPESDSNNGKNSHRGARTAYRLVIVICAVALILAIIALYVTGKLDQAELP